MMGDGSLIPRGQPSSQPGTAFAGERWVSLRSAVCAWHRTGWSAWVRFPSPGQTRLPLAPCLARLPDSDTGPNKVRLEMGIGPVAVPLPHLCMEVTLTAETWLHAHLIPTTTPAPARQADDDPALPDLHHRHRGRQGAAGRAHRPVFPTGAQRRPNPRRRPPRRRHRTSRPPALLALLAGTALLYLVGLGASGWAATLYSAAAQAGATRWIPRRAATTSVGTGVYDRPPRSTNVWHNCGYDRGAAAQRT